MLSKKINGYTVEFARPRPGLSSLFVVLIDERGKRHAFNMIKPDGKWIIRNPLTVPAFILQIEEELSQIL
jgi:hypothetical protein